MSEFPARRQVALHDSSNLRASLLSFQSKSENHRSTNDLSALLTFFLDNEEAQKGFDWEVKYNASPLWILGLWPLDNKFVNLKFTLCLILMLIYALPSIVRIVAVGSDGSVEIITEVTPIIYTIIQFCVFKSKSIKVKIILTRIYEDSGQSVNLSKEYKKPMLLYGSRTRSITAVCIAFIIISCIGYYGEPLVTTLIKGNSSIKSLPNNGVYPFDTSRDTSRSPIYQIIYAMQAFVGCLCAISISSIDAFLMLSVFHGCGQLAVLCKIIGHYEGQRRHERASSDDSEKKLKSHCSCLKCIVDRHVSLTKYAKIVDDVFNGIIMARLITNTVHFCGSGYIITKSNENSDFFDLLLNLVYMGTMTFNFFLYCWIGEQLLEEGENVGRAVYKIDWHKEVPKVAQSLMLPILHSRRPLEVTAGKFFIMSLSCFKEWSMNSVGYLSVLLAINTHT